MSVNNHNLVKIQMEEYPKTACLYHPQENITNFCR